MANPQNSFTAVILTPGTLLHSRRTAVSRQTLLYQLQVLKDTGRYDAFKLQWHPSYSNPPDVWPIPNHLFWDSDVGKWIEGACYFLMSRGETALDSTIQAAVDELVDMIASAQQPDGYLNIHYTVVAPGLRFTNLRDMHELYNCGHLIEAALAHDDLVQPKSSTLFTTMLKYVDLLCTLFGPAQNQMHGYPGHPEIELALLRLYKRTKDARHLALAEYFITERGNPTGSLGHHYFLTEAARRGEDPHSAPSFMGQHNAFWYHQAHLPIAEQTEIKGHSVRAMYLLTAAADLCLLTPTSSTNQSLSRALQPLWEDMVHRKMYVTGGIGAMKQWEGFGLRYFLPQSTDEGGCYAETCASIGIMMLAERLLQLQLDGSVADVMELALYNTVLAGMSTDGRKFTYVNQLASSEGDLALREEWFTCACCPPNVLRCLGMLGGYIYTFKEDAAVEGEAAATINVHLFVSSSGTWSIGGNKVTLTQQSDYPWDGKIQFALTTGSKKVGANIRIPSWAAQGWSLSPALPKDVVPQKGYINLPSSYLAANPKFTLDIPLAPRLITPHPRSNQAHTLVVARGPIVYCVEDADNEQVAGNNDHFRGVHLATDCFKGYEENEVVHQHGDESGPKKGGERYVELTLRRGVRWMDLDSTAKGLSQGRNGVKAETEGSNGLVNGDHSSHGDAECEHRAPVEQVQKLVLVPFYYRANRTISGGVSRVGLRRWYGP